MVVECRSSRERWRSGRLFVTQLCRSLVRMPPLVSLLSHLSTTVVTRRPNSGGNSTGQDNAPSATMWLLLLAISGLVLWLAVRQRSGGSLGERMRWVFSRLLPHPGFLFGPRRALLCSAVTSTYLVRPTGRRETFPRLVVRMAPEDLQRFAPDGDLARLESDLAEVYMRHARREGFAVPAKPRIFVEADPGLRRGWIPRAVPAGIDFVPRAAGLALDGRPSGSGGLSGMLGWWAGRSNWTEGITPESRASDASTQRLATRQQATRVIQPRISSPRSRATPQELVLQLSDGRQPRFTKETIVGRGVSCGLRCTADSVSSRHAAIRPSRDGWTIRDLGSTNGTVVNGSAIRPGAEVSIRVGDNIRLGMNGPSLKVITTGGRGSFTSGVTTTSWLSA